MPTKHALLIGVDRYPNLDAQYQLSGCVSDARLIGNVLVEHFGFAEQRIRSLHNEAASRAAILAALEQLLADVAQDDVVFVHFSGHGSRRTSASAEEATGKDSTIMPSDSGRDPLPNLDISDDEIGAWLAQLTAKTRAASLLFDCCHSGTITRDPFAARVRAAPDDERSLAAMGIEPAELSRLAAVHRSIGQGHAARAVEEPGWMAAGDACVVMSGCRASEFANEFTDQRGGETIRNGALTHYLVGALLEATPGTTWRDVFETARVRVTTRFAAQHPQIEGAVDRELFGDRDIVPFRFVSIAAVDGDQVTLNGGAAHGLQPGSRWSVYPPGCKSTAGVAALGAIAIARVDTLTASGRVLEGAHDVVAGARCIEVAPAVEHLRLAVDLGALPNGADAGLVAAVAASPLLQRAGDPEAADVRVYRLAPQAPAAGDAHGSGAAPARDAWKVVDRTGEPAMPLVACADADAVARVVANLEALARYRSALALDNPQSTLPVEFTLHRETADGQWRRMDSSGEVLTAGDSVAFEVVNRAAHPVFVSVLDFGVSGRIQPLYPPNGRSEQLDAGRTLKIGTGQRRIRLGLPQGFVGERGRESFKLFVTTDETDFGWLQQAGTRSLATARSRLQQQFAAAFDGPRSRDAALDAPADGDADWRAFTRAFELRRA